MPQLLQLNLDDNIIGLDGSDAIWKVAPIALNVRGIGFRA